MTLPRLTKSTDKPIIYLRVKLALQCMKRFARDAYKEVSNFDTMTNGYISATFYQVPGGPYHTVQRTKADCYAAVLERING